MNLILFFLTFYNKTMTSFCQGTQLREREDREGGEGCPIVEEEMIRDLS